MFAYVLIKKLKFCHRVSQLAALGPRLKYFPALITENPLASRLQLLLSAFVSQLRLRALHFSLGFIVSSLIL